MPLFTIISVYENIFSDRKKMIRILSRSFLKIVTEIYERHKREGDRRNSFLVHLLKFESDTAISKKIAIIRLW